MEHLHSSIREFWKDRYDEKKYVKYSVFHKSVIGSSIDLSESDKATRIVSIHSSKGDGRPVVFVVGVSESALKIFSGSSDNLVFDSLLHVALTRMKEKLYFRYEPNGDLIHRHLTSYQTKIKTVHDIKPYLNIYANMRTPNLLKYNVEDTFQKCNDLIITQAKLPTLDKKHEEKQLIDMKHHNTRYSVFYMQLVLQIITYYNRTYWNTRMKQPIYQILKQISKEWEIVNFDTLSSYWEILNVDKKKFKDTKILPLREYRGNNQEYRTYYKKLINYIDASLSNIQKILDGDNNVEWEYMQSIVLYHLFDVHEKQQYTQLPITDVYDIIYEDEISTKDKKAEYLKSHYKKIELIESMFEKFSVKFNNLTFLVSHPVEFNGRTEDFAVYSKLDLLAYNDKHVIICYVKPQFNMLNYNETLLKSVFDTFIIKNCRKYAKDSKEVTYNYNNFNGKQIHSCVFTFDNNNTPYLMEWINSATGNDLVESNNDLLLGMIKNNILTHYEMQHDYVYVFFRYWYHNFKDAYENPKNTIEKIIDKLNEKKGGCPKYIRPKYINDFFEHVKRDLKKGRDTGILDEYYDKREHFMKDIKVELDEAVSKFLGVPEDDDD